MEKFQYSGQNHFIDLIKKLKVPLKKVAIELNQKIVNKKSLGKIKIKKMIKLK